MRMLYHMFEQTRILMSRPIIRIGALSPHAKQQLHKQLVSGMMYTHV